MEVKLGKIASAGNKGKGIRSDCFITIEIKNKAGIRLQIESKVKTLYGKAIEKLLTDILSFFDIKNAEVALEDSGALDFVIAARMEAAIKQLIKTEKEYLPNFPDENKYHTNRDRNRISRLYLPGNTPNLMINAGIHKPDGIILDLEDAVAPAKKAEAQLLVRNALRSVSFYGAEKMVRINQVPLGLDDLEYVIPHRVNLILVPKCESADQIILVDKKIKEIQKKKGVKNPVWLMPIIESCLGVFKSLEIAMSSENIAAMAIGLEDYTADLGTKRTLEATESFFARCQVVNACRAAGIQPIDSVFSDVADLEGLKQNIIKSKALGFDGMGCIHPRQIKVIHDNYAPDAEDIEKAKKIITAFDEANEKGLGVVSVGTKMIDAPVVKRAQRLIEMAVLSGKLDKNWKETDNEKK